MIAKGNFERIGSDEAFYALDVPQIPRTQFRMLTHTDAVGKLFEVLGFDKQVGKMRVLGDVMLSAIGHRVVHGGEKFRESVLASPEVLKGVEEVSHFAPLHNPANLAGVRSCMELLPSVPNVLVFDTAFHASMPPKAYCYGIAREDAKKFGIRKYGFHGTSYSFVSKQVAQMFGKPLDEIKMVVAHLGNGASVTAIDKGKSLDTSMGLTPLEGLIMGTRSGDIDVAAAVILAKLKGLDMDGLVHYLNNSCGLKGMGGTGTEDMRVLCASAEGGSQDARSALDAYVHRIVKTIGGLVAVIGGVDAIAFTAGIGTKNATVREAVMAHFDYLGANIDKGLNNAPAITGEGRTGVAEISGKGAKVRTFVVATNEELEIALEVQELIEVD